MNIDLTNLKAEAAAIEARIATYTISLADSQAAADRMVELMDDIPNNVDEIRAISDSGDFGLINDTRQLAKYRDTLAADLMQISTRYVVTDTESLESPAGFHPDTNVYLQTTIAIHTDSLNRIPASNRKLYAHEVN